MSATNPALPSITLVLGIDAKTVQQLEVSHRTWKKFHPELWQWPWVVFFDGCCEHFSRYFFDDAIKRCMFPAHVKTVPWPQTFSGNARRPTYESQREKMLSGFCYVPALHVDTPYWLKLDTDALATRESDWPCGEWFDGQPEIIAPAWNYTKGINYLGRLEEWGDKTQLRERPRLNIPFDPTHLRVPHKRWCSWNSFYSTDWTRSFVGLLLESGMERGKLPVPSQDSAMWYAAERGGATVKKVNMKKFGWTNVPKLSNLIEQAQSILRGEVQEAITDG